MLTTRSLWRRAAMLGGAAALSLSTAGLSLTPAGAVTKHSGPVDVYYAASLQDIMEQVIGPHFHKATGYTFNGFSGASGTLANELKGGIAQGDVFISASPSVNNTLEGPTNGNLVSWYVAFGNSPLVIGYSTSSSFAHALQTEPWFKVITQSGFRIGRTDPTVDPKGKLTVQAITAAEQIYNTTALASVISSTANIFPEQSLVGELQSGQLDAGFFYASEAKAAKIPMIKLGKIFVAATYTITVLNNAPDVAAAQSFVSYLLSQPGTALLKREGVTVVKPNVVPAGTILPATIRKAIKKT